MTYDDKVRQVGDIVFSVTYSVRAFDIPTMTEKRARDFAQKVAAKAERLFR